MLLVCSWGETAMYQNGIRESSVKDQIKDFACVTQSWDDPAPLFHWPLSWHKDLTPIIFTSKAAQSFSYG